MGKASRKKAARRLDQTASASKQSGFVVPDVVRHAWCNRFSRPPALSLVCTDPAAPWMADDREWFKANPSRSFRLRGIYPGEFPPTVLPGCRHVLVRQLAPRWRDKLPISDEKGGELLDTMPDDEALLLALWESNGERATPAELGQRAALLEQAAGNGGVH